MIPLAWRPKGITWRNGLPLFVFGIVIFWKVIFTAEYSMLAYADSAQQTNPWAQYIAQSLHSGSFPFWDIYTDAGGYRQGTRSVLPWLINAGSIVSGSTVGKAVLSMAIQVTMGLPNGRHRRCARFKPADASRGTSCALESF